MTTHCATRPTTFQVTIARTLRGPNIWSPRPVLELILEDSELSSLDWRRAESLLESLGLTSVEAVEVPPIEACASWFGAAVIKLQVAAGSPVSFHTWRRTDDARAIQIAVEYEEEAVARATIAALERWLRASARGEPVSVADEWERLSDMAYDVRLGNTTGSIVEAAAARGIPYQRLDDESLVQLGQGRWQRRVRMATTDRTGSIGASVATDKQLTKRLLQEVGVPVPPGREVSDAVDARRAAEEVGWPVVVKPRDADYGNGVSIRLTSAEQLSRAYEAARRWSERVLVERFIPGTLYRLLVVSGRLIAAVRREPAYVVGDGRRTILELLEEASHDPSRGDDYVSPWKRYALSHGAMPIVAAGGESNDSIPADGQTVPLVGDIYMRFGGRQQDRTAEVHPDIAMLAIDTSRIVGLDIAGLDVIAEDITQPPDGQSVAILEVNPEPALILHMAKFCTPPRPVAEAIVESLFPDNQSGRVPVIAVLSERSDPDAAGRLVAQRRRRGETVGLAARDGAWLNQRRLGPSCKSIAQHTRRLWRHPRTDAVVVHLTLSDILAEGVPFDQCDDLVELIAAPPADTDASRALECLRATRRTDPKCQF